MNYSIEKIKKMMFNLYHCLLEKINRKYALGGTSITVLLLLGGFAYYRYKGCDMKKKTNLPYYRFLAGETGKPLTNQDENTETQT